jgi:group I intron endonuclease
VSRSAPINAVVYQATNSLNGHRYIGLTIQGLAAREREHRKLARRPTGGYHFHSAMRKYGEDNFVFTLMGEFGDDEELAKLYEREAIEAYKPEYNLSRGGEGGSMPEITRQRISASNKGRVGPMKGKKFTEEHKTRLRAALTDITHEKARGKPFTEERRRKLSDAARKRTNVPWNKGSGVQPKKPVVCVTDGQVFDSVTAAAAFYGIHQGAVRDVLKGRRAAIRGFVFAYVEDGA